MADLPAEGGRSGPIAALEARLRAAPVATSAALFGAVAVAYLASGLLLGGEVSFVDSGSPSRSAGALRFNLVLALLIPYSLWGGLREQRAMACDLGDLRGDLDLSDADFDALRRTALALRGSRTAAAIGAAMGALIPFLGIWLEAPEPAQRWDPFHTAWNVLLMVPLFAVLGARVEASIVEARIFGRLGRELRSVRLLDGDALAPFARVGLRLASYWFLGSALASLLFIDAGTPIMIAVVLVATVGVGLASLLVPAAGVHARVHEEKRRELARVRAELARCGAALLAADVAAGAAVPALAAWERRIAAVREWPFDTPTLVRFLLVLAVAIGSWLGGAVAERVIDALFAR